MIIKLQIECVWGFYLQEKFIRTIEIDEETSLADLHETIQDIVQFDRDHLFDFFLANSPSPMAKKQWLNENDDSWQNHSDYQRISLKDSLPTGRKKLYYLFDYGDNWLFEIRKKRGNKNQPEPNVKYPRVIEEIGPVPEQYPELEE